MRARGPLTFLAGATAGAAAAALVGLEVLTEPRPATDGWQPPKNLQANKRLPAIGDHVVDAGEAGEIVACHGCGARGRVLDLDWQQDRECPTCEGDCILFAPFSGPGDPRQIGSQPARR